MLSREAIRALPKAELHRHLDGSVRLQTIRELAVRHNLDLGVTSEKELREKATVTVPMKDLQSVLDRFATIQKVLCSYEAIKRVAFENVEDAFREGIHLIELRFAPAFIAAGKRLTNEQIIEAVLDGVTLAMQRYPIEVGLIGILPRGFEPEINSRVVRNLIHYAGCGYTNGYRICGFDLADAEDRTDPLDFVPFVEKARKAGLGITIHSGENTSAAAVERTLDLFRPQRIGHGIRIWGHDSTIERVRDAEVMLELCPTSNWITNSVPAIEKHPLPDLYKAGIQISINSDDPHLFAIDLVHEYQICCRLFGMKAQDFLTINKQTVKRSFLPPEIRKQVLEKFFVKR